MYFKKIPHFLTRSVRDALWHYPRSEKCLYLSFDDGPDLESTPLLLASLKRFEIPATFFCLGERVLQHPDLVKQMIAGNHTVAAHGMKHLDGWRTDKKTYLANAKDCLELLETDLYRPPYGRINWGQFQELKKICRVVLWDVMPGDFDDAVSAEKTADNIIKNIQSGSIIVLHDKINLAEKVHFVLKKIVPKLKAEGYSFGRIE